MHEEQLYRAALNGESEKVSELLAGGTDPNQVSAGEEDGLPLCAAAAWDRAEVTGLLLAAGADVNGRESGGWTALLWAAAKGHADTAELLVEAGAEIDAT